ncbi:hypothetical protein [Novosphingobium resinovorum]|uniref:hypothetical protein n=1 Tax=Novosphingobium resinovorum TaxID=158500 RepID=UPI0022F29726|nr:hypothetical protein [Novosphingobium resinovorum]
MEKQEKRAKSARLSEKDGPGNETQATDPIITSIVRRRWATTRLLIAAIDNDNHLAVKAA